MTIPCDPETYYPEMVLCRHVAGVFVVKSDDPSGVLFVRLVLTTLASLQCAFDVKLASTLLHRLLMMGRWRAVYIQDHLDHVQRKTRVCLKHHRNSAGGNGL